MSFEVIKEFENKVSEYFGSPYGIAIDSCTHGLELCLRLFDIPIIEVPKRTYLSVPMLANKLNKPLRWRNENWKDYYEISNSGIYDAAVLWGENTYVEGTYMCISFQFQKHLSLGRGGMILTDNKEARNQLKKMSYDGNVQQIISEPKHTAYNDGTFSPTSVTVFEKSKGGNDDIWVADGYGESYVHRFSSSGELISSINGEEGSAGRFNCPHGVWIDYRKSNPELYVADRANRRIQVYDLEGSFIRSFGSEVLNSPSAFAIDNSYMIVAELRARLAVFDIEDTFITYIGENESISRVERNSPEDVPGWPNNIDDKGNTIRSKILETGKFNSPHGIATDKLGNIYSGEWLIGGRYTKLEKIKYE